MAVNAETMDRSIVTIEELRAAREKRLAKENDPKREPNEKAHAIVQEMDQKAAEAIETGRLQQLSTYERSLAVQRQQMPGEEWKKFDAFYTRHAKVGKRPTGQDEVDQAVLEELGIIQNGRYTLPEPTDETRSAVYHQMLYAVPNHPGLYLSRTRLINMATPLASLSEIFIAAKEPTFVESSHVVATFQGR